MSRAFPAMIALGGRIFVQACSVIPQKRHDVAAELWDDESKPAVATTEANRLITQERVDALFGGTSSANGLAVSALSLQTDVFDVALAPQDSSITGELHGQDVLTGCPPCGLPRCPGGRLRSATARMFWIVLVIVIIWLVWSTNRRRRAVPVQRARIERGREATTVTIDRTVTTGVAGTTTGEPTATAAAAVLGALAGRGPLMEALREQLAAEIAGPQPPLVDTRPAPVTAAVAASASASAKAQGGASRRRASHGHRPATDPLPALAVMRARAPLAPLPPLAAAAARAPLAPLTS